MASFRPTMSASAIQSIYYNIMPHAGDNHILYKYNYIVTGMDRQKYVTIHASDLLPAKRAPTRAPTEETETINPWVHVVEHTTCFLIYTPQLYMSVVEHTTLQL